MDRQRVLRQAEKLVSKGKIDAAIKQYRKALDAFPRDTTTLNRVGDLYVRTNRVDDAMELFHRAAEHFSDEGFFVKAIAIYKKILRLDPGQLDVYEKLADLYHRQGLNTEAKNQYEVVADYHLKHEDLAAAIAVHARIVEIVPEDATQHLRLAELYQRVGRQEEALNEYREIAALMLEDGKVEEALRVYRSALEVDASDLEFVKAGVERLKKAGQIAAARELMSFAVDLNPDAAQLRVVGDRRGGESEETEDGVVDGVVDGGVDSVVDSVVEEASSDGADPAPEQGVAAVADDVVDPPAARLRPEPAVGDWKIAKGTVEEDGEETTEALATASRDLSISVAEEGVGELAEEGAQDTGDAPVGALLDSGLDSGPDSADEEETFEIDLAALEAEVATAVPEKATETVTPDELLPAASRSARTAPAADTEGIDLLAEATVLASYGLYGKAVDRLRELIAESPDRLDARERLVEVYIEQRNLARAAKEATELARLCFENDARDVWARLRNVLVKAEFGIERGQVTPPRPAPAPAEPVVASTPAEEPAPDVAAPPPEEEVAATVESEAGARAAEAVEPVAPAEAAWLAPESGVDSVPDATNAADELFAAEDEFFDLAAELEEELDREGVLPAGELISDIQEQSLDDIVEGFRKGVAEALSAEDFDTHYNLGVAYREMGLLDEAIGEFQLAAKDPRYLVDCCSLLAASFVEKGFPELAVKWFERGLESPAITDDEVLGLRYELGSLYQRTGDREKAHAEYVQIYGANSNYRDIVAKLEELRDHPADS